MFFFKRKKDGVLFTLFVATAVVMFWRGIWGLADLFLFPNNFLLSHLASILVGILVLLAADKIFEKL